MSSESIFQVCNTISMISWLLLIFATPFWKNTDKLLITGIITLFCIIYAWLVFKNLNPKDFENFSTLNGVVNLFANKNVVVGGWVHYLAFDLMTGIWITKNAKQHGINHWLIVPALFFTFMMGPVGLFLYLLIRFAKTKNYFADNYNQPK
jgi:hypothetical protein